MFWATTTFKVTATTPDLTDALRSWKAHIETSHTKVRAVRCYRFDGGTSYVWQEGFDNFIDCQHLVEEEDDVCEQVMAAVFRHMVPGTREGKVWSDGV
jgi:hypothetical protein